MTISGLHHLGLTVSDVERSAQWYRTVLGFEQVGEFRAPGGERRKIFLRHAGLAVRIGLTEHRDGARDAFDETRVGLDHLAFRVGSEDELREWQTRLADHRVPHTPITAANSIPGAAVLVLRDPDRIQLELFFDPQS